MNTMNPVIKVTNLTAGYDSGPVIWGVSFEIPEGVIAGIIGPNGAGKSTLLKVMVEILKPHSGTILFWNKRYSEVYKRIAYVPQKEEVDWTFPATVYDVVMMGRWVHKGLWKRITKQDKEIVRQALETVDMWEYRNRQISKLSGGQQQRVFFARALAQDPDLFLLDEPFAGVDIKTEETLLELLKQQASKGKTVVVVHHNLFTAAEHFQWLVLLNMHTVSVGSPEKVLTPKNIERAYGGHLPVLAKLSQRLSYLREKPTR